LGVAEDTGASETIDWQIYEQVCRDVNSLVGDAGTFVSINLSPRHFRNPELDRRLLRLLADHGVAPLSIRVEVTERAMLENPPEAKRILQTLRGAGIGVALDDFGTGYSSLSYLHQYPGQALKIDRSVITGLDADSEGGGGAVIRTILAMANLLSMQVIAEGVDTAAPRDLLLKMGCRVAQGFLYASAQPLETWVSDTVPEAPA
ncbi:MAG TPA: EAL domain-containing protein, partial [Rhodanobacteraceae bacterium]|nr:EAL domain-containing protein [Rhodanobacteraceae bacterium]